jgi:hypothetical protein
MTTLSSSALSPKTQAALLADGITSMEELRRRSRAALLRVPGIGRSRQAEIEEALAAAGLRARDDLQGSPLLHDIKAILSIHFAAKSKFDDAARALAKLIQPHQN